MRHDRLFVKLQESFRMIEEQGSNEELLKTPGNVFTKSGESKPTFYIVTNKQTGEQNVLPVEIVKRGYDGGVAVSYAGGNYFLDAELTVIDPSHIEDEEIRNKVMQISGGYKGKSIRSETPFDPSPGQVYPRRHGVGGVSGLGGQQVD